MVESPELLSIGEVAKRAGLRPSALRFYEAAGVLPAPRRSGGQRRYDASIFNSVRLVRAAQEAGFSIEEIKMLLDQSDSNEHYALRLQAMARRKLAMIEKLIADALVMKRKLEKGLACHCAAIEDCSLFSWEES